MKKVLKLRSLAYNGKMLLHEPRHEKTNNVAVRHEKTQISPIGTASANSAKYRGIRPRMYIEDLL